MRGAPLHIIRTTKAPHRLTNDNLMTRVTLLAGIGLLVLCPMTGWDLHNAVLDDHAVAGRGHLDLALDFWGQDLCSPTSHGSWRPLVSGFLLAQGAAATALGVPPLAVHRAATAALVAAMVAAVAIAARSGAGVGVLASGVASAWLLSHPAIAESVGLVVGQADLIGGATAALAIWNAVRASRWPLGPAAASVGAATALALVAKESAALVPMAAALGAEVVSWCSRCHRGPHQRHGMLASLRVAAMVCASGVLLGARALGRRALCGWSAKVGVFWPPSVNDVWLRPRLATRWLSLLERAAHHLSLLPGPALFSTRVPRGAEGWLPNGVIARLVRNPDWAVGSFPLVTETELAAWSPRVVAAAFALGVAVVVLVSGGVLACTDPRRARGRALAAGLCAAGAAMLPASGVALPVGLVVADRVVLMPAIGLAVVVAACVERLVETFSLAQNRKGGWCRWAGLAAVGLATAWLAHSAAEQQAALQGFSTWKEASGRAAVAAPYSGRPWLNLAVGQDEVGHLWPSAAAQIQQLHADAQAAVDRVTKPLAAACASAALPGELFGSPSQVCRCAKRLAASEADPAVLRAAEEALTGAAKQALHLQQAAEAEFGLAVHWPALEPCTSPAPASGARQGQLGAAELMLCSAAAQPCEATPLVAAGLWMIRAASLPVGPASDPAQAREGSAALGSRLVRAGLQLAGARYRLNPDLVLRNPGRPMALATAAYSLAALRHAPEVDRLAASPASASQPRSRLLAHMVAAHSLYGFAFDLLAAAGDPGQLAALATAATRSAVNESVVRGSPLAVVAQAATAVIAHGQGRLLQCKQVAKQCAGGSSAAAALCADLLVLCSGRA